MKIVLTEEQISFVESGEYHVYLYGSLTPATAEMPATVGFHAIVALNDIDATTLAYTELGSRTLAGGPHRLSKILQVLSEEANEDEIHNFPHLPNHTSVLQ